MCQSGCIESDGCECPFSSPVDSGSYYELVLPPSNSTCTCDALFSDALCSTYSMPSTEYIFVNNLILF